MALCRIRNRPTIQCRKTRGLPPLLNSETAGVNAMTKSDLIVQVSQAVEMSLKESEIIIDAIFSGIVRSLRAEEKVEIRRFGTFRTRQRRSRIGRNPKTGARVEVPAKKIPYFKPSKELKDGVNNSTTTVTRAE